MSITESGSGGGGWLQQRIKNILFSPASEWDRIDTEPATVKGLYTGYACILAAIGPVARLVGGQVFGRRGISYDGLDLRPLASHPLFQGGPEVLVADAVERRRLVGQRAGRGELTGGHGRPRTGDFRDRSYWAAASRAQTGPDALARAQRPPREPTTSIPATTVTTIQIAIATTMVRTA